MEGPLERLQTEGPLRRDALSLPIANGCSMNLLMELSNPTGPPELITRPSFGVQRQQMTSRYRSHKSEGILFNSESPGHKFRTISSE